MASWFFPSPKCIVFVALLHILLPLLCRHLPFSFYFNVDPLSNSDENSEEERAFDQLAIIARSEEKLANIAKRGRALAKIAREGEQQHNPLAVLVLTAKRQGVSYLGRSLHALHKELHRDAVDHQHLVFVCTGEEALGLRELPFPILQPNTSLPYLPPGDQKAKKDLVFCSNKLEKMLPKSVEHILILEEDAVLMDNFFSTLLAWMSFHSERLQSEPWLDIKLYLNPRLRGWAWDPLPLVELLASTSLFTLISHIILTRLQEPGNPSESWWSLVFLWLAILAALLLVGRQHWLQWTASPTLSETRRSQRRHTSGSLSSPATSGCHRLCGAKDQHVYPIRPCTRQVQTKPGTSRPSFGTEPCSTHWSLLGI